MLNGGRDTRQTLPIACQAEFREYERKSDALMRCLSIRGRRIIANVILVLESLE